MINVFSGPLMNLLCGHLCAVDQLRLAQTSGLIRQNVLEYGSLGYLHAEFLAGSRGLASCGLPSAGKDRLAPSRELFQYIRARESLGGGVERALRATEAEARGFTNAAYFADQLPVAKRCIVNYRQQTDIVPPEAVKYSSPLGPHPFTTLKLSGLASPVMRGCDKRDSKFLVVNCLVEVDDVAPCHQTGPAGTDKENRYWTAMKVHQVPGLGDRLISCLSMGVYAPASSPDVMWVPLVVEDLEDSKGLELEIITSLLRDGMAFEEKYDDSGSTWLARLRYTLCGIGRETKQVLA